MPRIRLPLLRQWLLALAFTYRAQGLQEQEAVLFSGSYAPLAVRHLAPGTRALLYCHTPPRFLYDQREAFVALCPAPARPLLHHFCAWLRPRYESAVGRMSALLTNSEAVRLRIQNFLGRRARVVYPPCRLENYTWQPSQGYYLSMVRLDALKRVELCVQAFRQMPQQRLVILSDGPEAASLRRLAADAPNIHFCGTVSEAERVKLLAQCTATLCTAKEEDFGMCAVESLAAGKPVIAARGGGLTEICASPAYSFTLPANPQPEDICQAVAHCSANTAAAMRAECRHRAEDFALPRFVEAVRQSLEANNADL